MVLSENNKIRLQALVILVSAHVFIILFLPADREFKITLSSAVLFLTALFIAVRGRLLRRKKQIEELL